MDDSTQHNLLALLAKAAFFELLAAADRARLLQQMQTMNFANGTLIFGRGDVGNALYVLLSGRVRLSIVSGDGRELSFLHAAEGAMFGEIAAFDGGTRTADATALSATRTLVLSRQALQAEMAAHSAIADAALRFLCGRLRATNDRLEAIALHSVEVRLARFLLASAKAESAKAPVKPGQKTSHVILPLDLSQTDIGLMIGASRPKVNGAFSLLEADGTITRQNKALLCDMGLLAARADGEDVE
jgi:CRP/FNR family transcriptional regulator, cyclic AMP receptor protein